MSLALYRTYRPARLADVVGQEHITTPLARALDNDRVHHAYLSPAPRLAKRRQLESWRDR